MGKNRLLTIFSRPRLLAGGKKRGSCRLGITMVLEG
jgi:hypothetical protein